MKFIYISLFLFCLGIYAVPTPPTIEELIKNSDFIAKSRLVKLKENKLNKYTISVNATAEIKDRLSFYGIARIFWEVVKSCSKRR
jgi:hypothetical protein